MTKTVGAMMVLCLLALVLSGAVNSLRREVSQLQQGAVTHGCAAYSPQTGAWAWRDTQ